MLSNNTLYFFDQNCLFTVVTFSIYGINSNFQKNFQFKQIMLTVEFLLITMIALISADQINYEDQENWGYDCKGLRQSPINIETTQVTFCPRETFFQFNSKGAIIVVDPEGIELKSSFVNQTRISYQKDGIINNYQSLQFHFHQPSEHQINGKHFDMELHIVHQNVKKDGTLAVVSLLFQIDQYNNDKVFNLIDFTNKSPQRHPFPWMLKDKFIFHYEGSLTTPPCSEVVDWFVHLDTFKINPEQFKHMKEALNSGALCNRNVQDHNGRDINILAHLCKSINT